MSALSAELCFVGALPPQMPNCHCCGTWDAQGALSAELCFVSALPPQMPNCHCCGTWDAQMTWLQGNRRVGLWVPAYAS